MPNQSSSDGLAGSSRDAIVEVEIIQRDGFSQVESQQQSGSIQFRKWQCRERKTRNYLEFCLGYRRCKDFDFSDAPGQDYALLRSDTHYVCAIVSDGVSQSFFGNLASRHLSIWLLEELWDHRDSPLGQTALEKRLRDEQEVFSGLINDKPIDDLPSMIKIVLERTRKKGSQTVFSAFLWDRKRDRLDLYQVGDVVASIQFSDGSAEWILPDNVRGRWSSAGKSELFLKRTTWCKDGGRTVTGILLQSDGADPKWRDISENRIPEEKLFCEMATRSAGYDDVSFVAARLVQKQLFRGRIRRNSDRLQSSRLTKQAESRRTNSSVTATLAPKADKEPTLLGLRNWPRPFKSRYAFKVIWKPGKIIILFLMLVMALALVALFLSRCSLTPRRLNSGPIPANKSTNILTSHPAAVANPKRHDDGPHRR